MAEISPTQRSIAALKKAGWIVGIVEKRNAYAGPAHLRCAACGKNKIGLTQDLFGFVDLLAVRGRVAMAVQTTSGANLAARISKAMALPEYAVVAAALRIEFHGWRLAGKKGNRKLWDCRVVVASEGTYHDAPADDGIGPPVVEPGPAWLTGTGNAPRVVSAPNTGM